MPDLRASDIGIPPLFLQPLNFTISCTGKVRTTIPTADDGHIVGCASASSTLFAAAARLSGRRRKRFREGGLVRLEAV